MFLLFQLLFFVEHKCPDMIKSHFSKKVCESKKITAFDSDKHTIIGDKNIGITKISATKLKTLRRAEIHF